MPVFFGLSPAPTDRPGGAAVLLVNLGTPDAPTPSAVRRYLAQFLWDPRVIEQPRWLWWLILRVILLIRPRRSAHAYSTIWTTAGSPLLVHTRALAAKLHSALLAARPGSDLRVAVGMCYGQPDLGDVMRELTAANVRRLLVLPLYPQYSGSSTGAALDALANAIKTLRWPPELRIVNEYYADAGHIEALARSVEAHWRDRGRADRLLLSFHGIPQRYVASGDPYAAHCLATARLLRERLGLSDSEMSVSFQSRVGREPWLAPYTDETMRRLPGEGVRSLQVMCPGFAVDCLETLEEIAMQNRELFLQSGGERFEYIPCLNDSDDQVASLVALVARHTGGWAEFALDTPAAERSGSQG